MKMIEFLRRPRVGFAGLLLVSGSVAAVAASENVSFGTVREILERTRNLAFSFHPTLEKEEANEGRNILEIAARMFQIQMATSPETRDAHAKGHVCAAGEFTVDANVPQRLRAGLFARPSTALQALVRFSNGSGRMQPDAAPDGRGIAIKLLGGAPAGNLIGTGNTQDFLLINGPNFFVRSIADYAFFQEIILTQRDPKGFFAARAIREALALAGRSDAETLPNEAILAILAGVAARESDPAQLRATLARLFGAAAPEVGKAIAYKLGEMARFSQTGQGDVPRELRIAAYVSRAIGSSATETYFSMSSYLLKAPGGDAAVKYAVRPIDCATERPLSPTPAPAAPPAPNFLRDELSDRLSKGDLCFRFTVQPLPDNVDAGEKQRLVEDATLDFASEKSPAPETPVARLRIPKQETLSESKLAYCEALSFNPWQSRPEHQPLGSMNRARKWAVTASSIRRHLVRGAERVEPTSTREFCGAQGCFAP